MASVLAFSLIYSKRSTVIHPAVTVSFLWFQELVLFMLPTRSALGCPLGLAGAVGSASSWELRTAWNLSCVFSWAFQLSELPGNLVQTLGVPLGIRYPLFLLSLCALPPCKDVSRQNQMIYQNSWGRSHIQREAGLEKRQCQKYQYV